MSRSSSTQDLYKATLTRLNAKSQDEELLELCNLSGVPLDPEVFKILMDLLKLNVSPTSLVQVLRKVASTNGYRNDTLTASKPSDVTTEVAASRVAGPTKGDRLGITSRLRELRANKQ